MDELKLYLSRLGIDGQLYDLKDAEARTSIAELNQTIIDNEQVTAAALNDLEARKAEKTDIPTKVSDLTNDVPFATKAQLDALSDTLSGKDSDFLAQLQNIIAELEGSDSEAANTWTTLVDKVKGLEVDGQSATVKEYVDAAIAAIPPTDLSAIESAIQALKTDKVNKADIEEVAISQNTFNVVDEKLVITTTNVNVLKNKVAAGA